MLLNIVDFLQGIKITNRDSKAQVLEILKAEQAAKMMDLERPGASAAAAADRRVKKSKKKKLRLAKDAKASRGSRKATAAATADAAMEG
jgi:hypothetical protein